jgi:hypothetical protein
MATPKSRGRVAHDPAPQKTTAPKQSRASYGRAAALTNLPALRKAARGYVAKGWALVPVRNKRPMGDDWNTATAMHDAAGIAQHLGPGTKANGVGVLLGKSKLCSFDADDLDRTRAGLAKLGIDADAVLDSGWHVQSGKPNSARALFSLPKKGAALRWMRLRVRRPREQWKTDADGAMHPTNDIVFELRAGSPNLQDVLPPSLHTSGTTYKAPALPERLPVLAGPLVELWRRWQADPKGVEAELFEAFGVPVGDRVPSLSGEPGKLDFPSSVRVPYNAANSVETILLRNGYAEDGTGRYAHPGATGSPGCMPLEAKDDLWHSHNGGDPLHGTFDAWCAHVVLDHDGNQQAAEAAWYAEHPKGSEFAAIEGEDDDDDDPDDGLLRGLPELPDEALYGVLRPIVEAATKHTEATRVGVAMSALVQFAARYGGALRLRIGDDDRTVPLFALLVGPTGKGRKGTSAAFPRQLFKVLDELITNPECWDDNRTLPGASQVVAGVSSGQGIIDLVRDEGQVFSSKGSPRMVPGAHDKRLFIDLSEFASALVVSGQDGNILSQVLRDAFDGMPLASPARTNQLRATDAHICILGHITMHEFRKQTVETKRNTDVTNGLLNRFCIVYSARNKLVPNPQPVPDMDKLDLAIQLADNVRNVFCDAGYVGENSRRVVEYVLDGEAQAAWDGGIYAEISNHRYDSEVVHALLSRRDALVRILSVLLAAINGERIVTEPALRAALAWSQYMVDSTSHVFAKMGERRKANELRQDIADITRWAKEKMPTFTKRDFTQRWARKIDAARREAALRAMLEAAPPQLVRDGTAFRLITSSA